MTMFKKFILLCTALLSCGAMTLATGCDEAFKGLLPDSSTQTPAPDEQPPVQEYYTVTFKNYDGTVLKTIKIEAGEVPSYTGETPQKPGDAQYCYVFSGWDKTLAETTADVEYIAQFTQETNAYAVTFVGEDGAELQTVNINYGEKVSFSGELPEKEGYSFSHWYVENGDEQTTWDMENDTITGALTLKVAYALNTYAVSFTPISGGSAIPTQTIEHGSKATEPVLETKDGWTWAWYNGSEVWNFNNAITQEITLKAKYTKIVTATEAFEVYSSVTLTKDASTQIVTSYSLTPNTFEIAITDMAEMTVASASINGTATEEFTFTTNRLAVNGSAFGSKTYGDVGILLSDENGDFAIVVNVPVVTKYMENFDDLNNMPYYGGIDLSKETKPYDGYFVMTQSIDCGGNYVNRQSNYVYTQDMGNSNNATAYANVGQCGFAGVFDGQGYAIENIQAIQYHYGLFGNTQKGSVIKNVAITATLNASADYGKVLLGWNLAGDIQNSYFDVTVGSVTLASGKHLGGALGQFISGKLTDVVVKFDTTNVPTDIKVGVLALQLHPHPTYWENRAVFENVHVFSQVAKLYSYVGDNALGVVNKYGYDESATVTMTDNTYWNMGGDQPVFKSIMAQVLKTIAYNQETPFEVYSSVTLTKDATTQKVTSYSLTSNAFTLDLTAYNIPANPNSITIIGDRASMTVDNSCWSNGVLTVADLGAKVYGDVRVEIETDDVIYKVKSLKVVTKYMANYNDLNNMIFYGGIDLSKETKPYDGYFVMTQSIDCGGNYVNRPSDYAYTQDMGSSNNTTAYANVGQCGFAGVFDGQGYAIKNIQAIQYHYGLFGNTQTGSVIKNVAVTATLNASAGYGKVLLGWNLAGEIQNSYFDVTVGSVTLTSGHLGGALGQFISGKLTDVVVKFDTTNVPTGVSVGGLAFQLHPHPKNWENQAVFTNVHVFTQATNLYSYVGANAKGNATKYGYDESATVTMTDSTYWDLSGSQPVWKERTQA